MKKSMKKSILLLAALLSYAPQLMAQAPKKLVGKTLYNTQLWNLNPRFGGVPTIRFDSPKTATVKKGDVVENASVKKYKNTLIITTQHRQISDTLTILEDGSKTKNGHFEYKDQKGQVWTSRFSESLPSAELKAYPEAQDGFKRTVITLPPMSNEKQHMVAVYAGIYHETDCNKHFLIGGMQTNTLEGYGYEYFTVETDGMVGSTMMACPQGSPKTKSFVHLQPIMINYNSKVPIVVYAPENVQIRYKVFTEDEHWGYGRQQ